MSEHPWDDLTDEELTSMVDFCRKFFRKPSQFSRTILRVKGAVYWEWKKGDWFWSKGNIELFADIVHKWYNEMDVTMGWVPLPLAHQWDELAYQNGVWSIHDVRNTDIVYQSKILANGTHSNPHYRRYLAFRKVIENG